MAIRLRDLRRERDAWIAAEVGAGIRRLVDIAADVGLHPNMVRQIAKRQGVARNHRRATVTRIDRTERNRQIAELVSQNTLRLVDIGVQFGLGQETISRIANAQGVRRQGTSPFMGGGLHAPANPERNQRIREMAESGLTFTAVGVEFGLTRERVRQLLARQGISPTDLVRARREARQFVVCPRCGETYRRGERHQIAGKHLGMRLKYPQRTAAIVADYEAGLTYDAIKAKYGVESPTIMWALRRTGHAPNRRRLNRLPTIAESRARKAAIKAAYLDGEPVKAIAERFGVSAAWVRLVSR